MPGFSPTWLAAARANWLLLPSTKFANENNGLSLGTTGGPERPSRAAGAGIDAERAISAWEEAHRPLLERFRQVQADLRAHKAIDLAMASVAMRELRNIAARA